MQEIQTLQSLDSIITELNTAYRTVHEHIDSLPESTYLEKPGDRWSPAEQLEHLILSSFPVAGALAKDSVWFDQFGEPKHREKDYPALKSYYYEVLNTGIKAPARFTPETAKVYHKSEQLASWEMIREQLTQRSADWTEADLDDKAMPHPALGLISVRQMLFFTILHTYHHFKCMSV